MTRRFAVFAKAGVVSVVTYSCGLCLAIAVLVIVNNVDVPGIDEYFLLYGLMVAVILSIVMQIIIDQLIGSILHYKNISLEKKIDVPSDEFSAAAVYFLLGLFIPVGLSIAKGVFYESGSREFFFFWLVANMVFCKNIIIVLYPRR